MDPKLVVYLDDQGPLGRHCTAILGGYATCMQTDRPELAVGVLIERMIQIPEENPATAIAWQMWTDVEDRYSRDTMSEFGRGVMNQIAGGTLIVVDTHDWAEERRQERGDHSEPRILEITRMPGDGRGDDQLRMLYNDLLATLSGGEAVIYDLSGPDWQGWETGGLVGGDTFPPMQRPLEEVPEDVKPALTMLWCPAMALGQCMCH